MTRCPKCKLTGHIHSWSLGLGTVHLHCTMCEHRWELPFDEAFPNPGAKPPASKRSKP